MKEVFYIGPYRQTDGWGENSHGVLSLLSEMSDIDLVIRPIWFNNQSGINNIQDLEDYEYKKVTKKDVLIQHGLPPYLNPNPEFKTNIAMLSLDCRIHESSWTTNLNLFDKIIVFTDFEKQLLEESGIKVPVVSTVTPPLILSNDKHDLGLKFDDKVKFYIKGSASNKSGIKEVITAFLSEFTLVDNAILCVASEQADPLKQFINYTKEGLGIFTDGKMYPNIVMIDNEGDPVMNYLHEYCDIYIDVGYNSKINQHLLRSVAYGSIPLCTRTNNIYGNKEELVVDTYEEICILPERPLPYLYTAKDTWWKPSVTSLKDDMRYVSQNIEELKDSMPQYLTSFKNSLLTTPSQVLKKEICL